MLPRSGRPEPPDSSSPRPGESSKSRNRQKNAGRGILATPAIAVCASTLPVSACAIRLDTHEDPALRSSGTPQGWAKVAERHAIALLFRQMLKKVMKIQREAMARLVRSVIAKDRGSPWISLRWASNQMRLIQ